MDGSTHEAIAISARPESAPMTNVAFHRYSRFRTAVASCEALRLIGRRRQAKLRLMRHRGTVGDIRFLKCRGAPGGISLAEAESSE
jgi:hypothetical protein